MAQIYLCLHSTFKHLSNDTSHIQIRVKMKKLWLQRVREEKQVAEHKLCCDKANSRARNLVATNPDYIATKLEDKLYRDKVLLCHDKVLDKHCHEKILLCGNNVLDKLCGNKVLLCRDKVLGIQNVETKKC